MITPEWVTNAGKGIRLANMSDDHIRNVIRYLTMGNGEYGPMLRPGCNGFTNGEWLQLCASDLARRQRGASDPR
jgi:hypothetical protein